MLKSGSVHMPHYTVREFLKAAAVLVCVSSFPALYIFAHNVSLAEPGDLVVPLVLIIAVSLIVGVLITLLIRSLHAGMVITATLVVLFFSYGQVYLLLANADSPVLEFLGRDIVLIPLCSAILILVSVLTFRLKDHLQQAIPAMLVFSIVLIAPLLFQIGSFVIQDSQSPDNANDVQAADATLYRARVDPLPDVYYIILDGYTRADILQQNYHYDNGEFIRALEQRGFYVAEESFSNYPLTDISVSSSLNMDYHDASLFEGSKRIKKQFQNMAISTNKVTGAFGALGYDYSSNRSSTQATSQINSRTNAAQPFETEFFYILTKSSLLGALDRLLPASTPEGTMPETSGDRSHQWLRVTKKPFTGIKQEMALLPEFADNQVPNFVYGHYLCPHPPYDFTTSVYEGEADTMDSTPWLDRGAYVREIQGLNQVVLNTIDEILARSDTPPIIIIQGDHGAATKFYENRLSWNLPAGVLAEQMPEDVRVERFAILNAYYGPPEMLAKLYPSISPVNSFRVVLSYLTDHEYPLLPDRSFIATYERPIETVEFPVPHQSVSP